MQGNSYNLLKTSESFPIICRYGKSINIACIAYAYFPCLPASPTRVAIAPMSWSVIQKAAWFLGPVLDLTPGGKALSFLTSFTLLSSCVTSSGKSSLTLQTRDSHCGPCLSLGYTLQLCIDVKTFTPHKTKICKVRKPSICISKLSTSSAWSVL